jgi:hypothetical protein
MHSKLEYTEFWKAYCKYKATVTSRLSTQEHEATNGEVLERERERKQGNDNLNKEIVISSYHRFPFPWYFSSWTSGAPHHSCYKFQIAPPSLSSSSSLSSQQVNCEMLSLQSYGRNVTSLQPSVTKQKRKKDAWSYTSTSQYAFMAKCLVRHRDKFTFFIYFYRGLFARGVKPTTHLNLVPSLRMRGSIPPLPNTSSWRGA